MKPVRRNHFTLIEMIVVLAIMVIAIAVVAAAFRGDSPQIVLNNAALDLEAYLAQVRYRAAEMGRDYVVKYPFDGKELIASPDYSREELETIDQPATSIFNETGRVVDKIEFIKCLLDNFKREYTNLIEYGIGGKIHE